MADFKTAYSNLVKAVWADPSVEAHVRANPALLKQYGFATVPRVVTFASAQGKDTINGYLKAQQDYQGNTGAVTFYVPPSPQMQATGSLTADGTSNPPDPGEPPPDPGTYCCCCPCCTST